jgi:hypothetical protein
MIVASISAEFSIVFNDSMMPRLVTSEDVGRISNIAWGMGYLGGIIVLIGVVLFIAASPDTGLTLLGQRPLFGLDPVAGRKLRPSGADAPGSAAGLQPVGGPVGVRARLGIGVPLQGAHGAEKRKHPPPPCEQQTRYLLRFVLECPEIGDDHRCRDSGERAGRTTSIRTRHGSCDSSKRPEKEAAMWYERWYQRMMMKRRARHVARNRAVQIASALAAAAGVAFGVRRWRATRV